MKRHSSLLYSTGPTGIQQRSLFVLESAYSVRYGFLYITRYWHVESHKVVPMEIPRSLTKLYRSSYWHTHIASKPQAKKATLIDRLARLAAPPVPPLVPLS